MVNNSVFEKFQSGFHKYHSTETSLLKVTSYLLIHLDAGMGSVLVLLDLAAAFDTVDHETLLKRRRDWVGLSGTALGWFSSYLSNRMCRVSIKNHTSSISNIRYGVPQGSILGPILFSIYMLPLGEVIKRHGISFHFYADDSQLYLPIKSNDLHMLSALHECLNDIKSWMALHFLQLNYQKTEILVIGPQ